MKNIVTMLILCSLALGVTLHDMKSGLEKYIDPPMSHPENVFTLQLELVGTTETVFTMSYYINIISGDLQTSSEWVLEDFICASVVNGMEWLFSKESVKESGYTFGGAIISLRHESYVKTSTRPIYYNRKYKLTANKYDELRQFVDEHDISLWKKEAEGLWSRFFAPINEEAKVYTADYKQKYSEILKGQLDLYKQKKAAKEQKEKNEEDFMSEMAERGISCSNTYIASLIKQFSPWILSQDIGNDVKLSHTSSLIWENGTWYNGTWEYGDFKNGIWHDGIWKNGDWYNGTWKNGTWKNGAWLNGVWENGVWENGQWQGGVWMGGIWKNGDWFGGVWKGGVWENGIWVKGKWEGGEWLGGYELTTDGEKYHKKGKSPDKWKK